MKHDAESPSCIAPKNGRTPLENLTGDAINLSEYLDFYFYDPVWYWDTLSGERGQALQGTCTAISHRVRVGMCCWVLNEQGDVISQSTVQHVTKEDLWNSTLKETLKLAFKRIKEKLSDEKHEHGIFPENKFFHKYILFDDKEEQDFDIEVPEATDYTE